MFFPASTENLSIYDYALTGVKKSYKDYENKKGYSKPIRYTWQFMERYDIFTVSFYSEDCRKDLALLGELSGRDGDKIARTKLTPSFLKEGVTFGQAELTLVCRKLYAQDLDRSAMPEDVRNAIYATEEPHRMFINDLRTPPTRRPTCKQNTSVAAYPTEPP